MGFGILFKRDADSTQRAQQRKTQEQQLTGLASEFTEASDRQVNFFENAEKEIEIQDFESFGHDKVYCLYSNLDIGQILNIR